MGMPAGPSAVETVEVKKRRLRVALRQARVDAKMTQKVAADELVWSTSKIVRIEQGTVPVTPTDVGHAAPLPRTDGSPSRTWWTWLRMPAKIRAGMRSVTCSRRPGWSYSVTSRWKVIYKYEPSVVPGLFQTQDYARSLLRALGNSEEQVERRLEARAQRQRMLDNPIRPDLVLFSARRRSAGRWVVRM